MDLGTFARMVFSQHVGNVLPQLTHVCQHRPWVNSVLPGAAEIEPGSIGAFDGIVERYAVTWIRCRAGEVGPGGISSIDAGVITNFILIRGLLEAGLGK